MWPRQTILALPPSLKAIATYSVGYEHVDVAAAKSRGIPVFNTPEVLTDAVAEIGMLLLLGAARRATESIDLIRGRAWTGWTATQLIGVELLGKQLGIFGMGRIGRGIAQRARAFGMTIHYCNRHRLPPDLEAGAIHHASFAAMAGAIDMLMIAANSSAETRDFLNRERLSQLKPGAIVANVARGELIDDDALIEALQSGQVRAAGLDVFDGEPNIDPRYYDLPNLFHAAAYRQLNDRDPAPDGQGVDRRHRGLPRRRHAVEPHRLGLGRDDHPAAFAEADADMARLLGAAAEDHLVAILEPKSGLAVRQRNWCCPRLFSSAMQARLSSVGPRRPCRSQRDRPAADPSRCWRDASPSARRSNRGAGCS